MIDKWYEAVGGLGLTVKRSPESEWHTVGIIQRKGKRWKIQVNPYQDEGYTLASFDSQEQAKQRFLEWAGVTEVTA